MKTLYLLRHAKAEPGTKSISDMDRPLNARGREACAAIGAYIKQRHYHPDFVISSPSARTRETLERVFAAALLQPPSRYIDKLYLATAEELLHYVRLINDSIASAMVVGHNPGMHHAALIFAKSERTPARITLELKYPTASLAALRYDVKHWRDVTPGEGELIDFVTPGQL